VAWVLGHLPGSLSAWVGRRLGDLLYLALPGRRRVALANLEHAFPELTPRERRRLGRRAGQHVGLVVMELCAMLGRPLDHLLARITVDGREHLDGVMASHGRALMLTGHLGNWEILSAAHRLAPYSLAVVVRPLDVGSLNALAERLRLKTGVELIAKRQALRPVLAALARGGMVAILLDQNASRREGVFVPFFGRLASTSRSLGVLSVRSGVPIVPIFARREAGGRHRVIIWPPLVPPATNDREKATVELTARCTATIEAAIRQAPEQWLWMHGRWRTRPEGQ
jgi:KDO2-lipid IV(A) lauroyltransferase